VTRAPLLSAACAAFALLAGCVTGAALRQRAEGISADVKVAHDQNAENCAPRELAVAEANLRFAQLELEQGDSFRAEEHLGLAEPAAHNAVANSKDCGKVTVLIRDKEIQPTAPGPPKVALKDTDGDGVPDIDDWCPDVPGPASNHGCPVFADRDGDGVADDIDRCPDVPGPKENFGCPWPDRDHDGVPDKDDWCPDEPGPADNHGCPRKQKLIVVRKDRIEIKQQVHFRPAKSLILPDSYELLREVAIVLKDAPSIFVRVEGHTDNVGKLATNLRVSQARADAVKAFLVKQGCDPKHISALGYGPTRPIASNATRAGKALNRRVEFRIVEADQK
jgi:outer membrane protein OmpA-like peptidoglycan-associated protein